jgi:hypothetical protein
MAKGLIPLFQGSRIASDVRPEEEKKRTIRMLPLTRGNIGALPESRNYIDQENQTCP